MRKTASFVIALCMFLSLFASSAADVSAAEEGRGIVFVATNGRDTAPGTIDEPLATVQAAQKKVREMKGSGLFPKGITVFVRGGKYNVSESFVFTEQDSGTEEAPIIWRNYENEQVTFTGGVNVNGSAFKKVTDNSVLSRIVESSVRDNIYSLDLKKYGVYDVGEPYLFGSYGYIQLEQLGITKPDAPPMEIFFNGEPMILARYPNNGWMHVESVLEPGHRLLVQDWPYPYGTPFVISVDDDRMKYWTSAPAGTVMMYGYWAKDWADQTLPIDTIDVKNKTIKSKYHAAFSVEEGKRFYVTNLLEELDMPGEYYIDRANSTLYIVPSSDIKSANVMLTILEDVIFRMEGASYIKFKGIDVSGARNNAFFVDDNSHHISVVDSEISSTAGYAAIFWGNHNGISDSYIHDVDGGVRLYGGDLGRLIPAENYCVNNEIENFARLTSTYKPAVSIDGVGNRAMHNNMHGAPHQAIAYGGQLNKIMYNDIYDVLRDADDAGVIYGGLSWVSRGHEIKYNYIHDIENYGENSNSVGRFGFYGDGGQCEVYVCGNIFKDIDADAVLVNGGWDNIVMNNIIIGTGKGIDVSAILTSDVETIYKHHYPRLQAVEKEIYAYDAWEKIFPTFYAMMAVPDTEKVKPTNNVVVNNLAYQTEVITDRTKRNADVVENNIRTNKDPGFVDINNEDFTLKSDAPVFDLIPGFEAIPFTRIGRLDELAMARIQNAVVMNIGSPVAMANGKAVSIDEENISIAPFIEGDRTYVPLRFLAESLGAFVDFSDGVITVSDSSGSIQMMLGSLEAKKNGENFTLDEPPKIIDGRTMVPLRQVSELLGKSVYWHDSGFISISDDDELFEDNDMSDIYMIDFLREKISYYR